MAGEIAQSLHFSTTRLSSTGEKRQRRQTPTIHRGRGQRTMDQRLRHHHYACNHLAFSRLRLDKLTGTLLEIPILSKGLSFIHSNESRMDVASTARGEAIHAEVSCVELPSQAESRSTGKPLSSERRDRGY